MTAVMPPPSGAACAAGRGGSPGVVDVGETGGVGERARLRAGQARVMA